MSAGDGGEHFLRIGFVFFSYKREMVEKENQEQFFFAFENWLFFVRREKTEPRDGGGGGGEIRAWPAAQTWRDYTRNVCCRCQTGGAWKGEGGDFRFFAYSLSGSGKKVEERRSYLPPALSTTSAWASSFNRYFPGPVLDSNGKKAPARCPSATCDSRSSVALKLASTLFGRAGGEDGLQGPNLVSIFSRNAEKTYGLTGGKGKKGGARQW